jgi:hypothetical protein
MPPTGANTAAGCRLEVVTNIFQQHNEVPRPFNNHPRRGGNYLFVVARVACSIDQDAMPSQSGIVPRLRIWHVLFLSRNISQSEMKADPQLNGGSHERLHSQKCL